jgi:RNA polymerase sigma-70 factor (ECF subfamily)
VPDAIDLPALLAAIATGDHAAFERLFRAWYPRLVGHARHLLHDADRAEEVAQEVFIALWRRRTALPEAGAMPGYLHRAVRNRSLNKLRGPVVQSLDDETTAPAAVPAAAQRDLEEQELGALVTDAIAALPARTAEVFTLSRDQGLTYVEIAAALDISVKTVETLMGRALRALRDTLRPRLVDPG